MTPLPYPSGNSFKKKKKKDRVQQSKMHGVNLLSEIVVRDSLCTKNSVPDHMSICPALSEAWGH